MQHTIVILEKREKNNNVIKINAALHLILLSAHFGKPGSHIVLNWFFNYYSTSVSSLAKQRISNPFYRDEVRLCIKKKSNLISCIFFLSL